MACVSVSCTPRIDWFILGDKVKAAVLQYVQGKSGRLEPWAAEWAVI